MGKERKTILIIEDELQFAESIKMMVQQALHGAGNIKFETVVSVKDARSALERNGFDLITLDGHLKNDVLCTELIPDFQKKFTCPIVLITRDDRIILDKNEDSPFYISEKIIPTNLRFTKGFGPGQFPGMKNEHINLFKKLLLVSSL